VSKCRFNQIGQIMGKLSAPDRWLPDRRGARAFAFLVCAVSVPVLAVSLASVAREGGDLWLHLMFWTGAVFASGQGAAGEIRGARLLMMPTAAVGDAAAILFGPYFAFATGMVGAFPALFLFQRQAALRALFNAGQLGLSYMAAGYVFAAVFGRTLFHAGPGMGSPFLLGVGAVLAVLVHQAANRLVVLLWLVLSGRKRPARALAETLLFWPAGSLAAVPAVLLVGLLYARYGYLAGAAALVLAYVYRARALRVARNGLVTDAVVDGLLRAFVACYPGFRDHPVRVAHVAQEVAREMGLSSHEASAVYRAGLLHDVGYLGLEALVNGGSPLQVGRMTGALSPRDHTVLGAEITRPLTGTSVPEIVLSHHERWDGTGYPRGLRGRAIPTGARILAVAEFYVTETSGGPDWGGSLAPEDAARAVEERAGTWFDPEVVEAFMAVWRSGRTDLEEPAPERAGEPAGVRGGGGA